MSKSVLIAGIGNIFHGDDAFGVAVAQRLSAVSLPDGVRVMDVGIRSRDLAFAVLDGYDLTILVDATPRGGKPGTLYLIEPELTDAGAGDMLVNSHALDIVKALRLAKSMGAELRKVLVVGCEPFALGDNDSGHIGLSAVVEGSVAPAVEMLQSLVREFVSTGAIALYAQAQEAC